MDPTVSEWLNLVVRWAHVITGIAWIGTSFFFNWLDSHLTPPERPEKGVDGELWLVHSGGFYQVMKKRLGPHEMPRTLHWFKWEAAFTWISGILLLVIVYYLGSGVYLIDPGVSDIGTGTAIALGIATIVVSWLAYDLLWRSPLAKSGVTATVLSLVLLSAIAFGLSQTMGGRGAFIHVGAVLGTWMAANVWVHIIPAQRQMVAATKDGREADPRLGAHAKTRSLHNNYMTLPVVYIMVSNHFPATYGGELNWAILLALSLAGVGVRHTFNLHNKGVRSAVWWLAPATLGLIAAIYLAARVPEPMVETAVDGAPASFAAVRAVIGLRCTSCHSARPSNPDFAEPAGDIVLDTPAQIQRLADRIFARAVVTRTMPLANATGMTEEERDLLGRWVSQGAAID